MSPRGEHLKKIDDPELITAFRKATNENNRPMVSSTEVANHVQITPEAVSERFRKMDSISKVGFVQGYWKLEGVDLFNNTATTTGNPEVIKNDIYTYIKCKRSSLDCPVVTINELCEVYGLTKPTIHRYMDDVVALEYIEEREIGQANVYWYNGIN